MTAATVASVSGAAGGVTTDGSAVLFSAVDESRVLRYDPAGGELTELRRFTSRMNGLAYSADGILYGAQSGSRRVLRLDPDGAATLLAERIDGRIHNHPADLSVDAAGRIWFSDPYSPVPAPGAQIFGRLEHASVLRLARDHRREWKLTRATRDTAAPYGVQVSADSSELYVTENDPDGAREVRSYPIRADGTLGPYRVLLAFGRDPAGAHRGPYGLCLAGDQLLVCAGSRDAGPGPMVYRLERSGRVLTTYVLPEDPVDSTLAGPDLYVTTTAGSLLRLEGIER